ncbi:hypothetical protein Btru_040028 [Bulinus truncatus]|nr:hypothetical protein Btru_040028 [Bulinus truncatus]
MAITYPGGVPDLACVSMFPSGHTTDPQLSDPPYKIAVKKGVYSPGETIQIEILGVGASFSGLYVQPRQVGCHVNSTRTVGVFTSSSHQLQTRHCFGKIHSTLTHTSDEKKKHVSFYWTAPVTSLGHVVIRATIVKDFQHFWTDVESPPLIDLQDKDTPTCVSHTHKKGFSFDHNFLSYQAKKSSSLMSNSAEIKSECIPFIQVTFVQIIMLWKCVQ